MNAFSKHDAWTQTVEGRIQVLKETKRTYIREMNQIEMDNLGPNGRWFFLHEQIEDIDWELSSLKDVADPSQPLIGTEIPF